LIFANGCSFYLDIKIVYLVVRGCLCTGPESAVSGKPDYLDIPRSGYPFAMGELSLQELNASNVVAANALSLKPGQEQFIAPVSYSAVLSVADPGTTWQRVVVDGDDVVGFIQANFDPDSEHEEFRSVLWRINVDADAQDRGIGTFAVHALADEARTRGFDHVNVIWEAGELGPGAFFVHAGFSPVGETQYGETIGVLAL
jgi:diamine N-acetyltransferase